MARDLTIRLLSRPKVSKDSQLGFQTLARKYVVQGPRACNAGILDANNPLFLPVGTTDEEFTDHMLVNQQLEPAQSMEKAYLVRTFAKLRERWVSESVSETADLIKLTRTFVVLRAQVSIYGYSASAWAKHPSYAAAKDTEEDPWDYAPEPVLNGAPGNISYTDSSASQHGLPNEPWVSVGGSSQSLSDYLGGNSGSANMGVWVRGTAQVNFSSPGVDIWSVTWVTHASPYWTFGTTGKGSGKSQVFTLVDFDHLGLKLTQIGGGGGGGSAPLQAKTYNTFYVGETLPVHLAQISGGTSVGASSSPSVSLDFHIRIWQGRTISFKQYLRNAVWTINTTEHLSFPTLDGNSVDVGEKDPYIMKFEKPPFIWDENGQTYMDASGAGLPMYQGSELAHIGGQITWSGTQMSLNGAGATVLNAVATKIAPMFRKGKTRIWKVQITYVG